jgi:prophage regulatory protein
MPNTATNPTRILSGKELRKRVPYSPVQIWRLEKAGTFPRRITLGPNRVGWVESEVEAWLRKRMDERGAS